MSFEYAGYLAFILAGTLALQRVFCIPLGFGRVAKTLLAVVVLFVAWDAWAVLRGHWSFNPGFLLGAFVGNQPVEEIAFFIVVPLFYIVIWEIAKRQAGFEVKKKTPAVGGNPDATPSVRTEPEKGGRAT